MTFIQVILFLAAIYNLVLAVIILWKNKNRSTGDSLAWYVFGTAAWSALVATLQFKMDLEIAKRICQATFVCGAVLGMSWLWFCANFPRKNSRFRYIAILGLLLGAPWLYLSFTDLVISSVWYEPWGAEAKSGPLVGLFALQIQLYGIAGIVHLLYKVKKVRGLERLQVWYILLGSVGLLLGVIPNVILPAISGSSKFAMYGPLTALIVTTTTTYAIAKYRLMDIRIVLRAGFIYSITISTLSVSFALIVPFLNNYLTEHLNMPDSAGSFLMAFLMALAFRPLLDKIQAIVDKRFFKSVYDYRLALRDVGKALASVRDRDLLANTLADTLSRTLCPRTIDLYLPGNNDLLMRACSVPEPAPAIPTMLPPKHPVIQFVTAIDDVVLTEELVRDESDDKSEIGQMLMSWNILVTIPLIASDKVLGYVFMGEKLSGDVFTSDDIGLLRILGKQAAIALDNVRHYDEMVLLNEYHEKLLQSMQDGVVAVDPAGRVITFNPAAEDITGVKEKEAVGRYLFDIGLSDLDIPPIGERSHEINLKSKTGTEIPLLITVTPFTRKWDLAPSRLVVFRDLSELRALELEKMQIERFSSMGAMAASIAHEIKNPLVPIRTFAYLLPTEFDDAEFRNEFSVTVVREVDRINRLVGQMLDLVRKPSHDHEPVDMRELIDRLIILIKPECDVNDVKVIKGIPDDLPSVFGDPGQIYQSFLNVFTNAVQVMPDGGELRIIMENIDDMVVCRISDTGPGVESSEINRIFEPLYTTKTGGHGLGLALTYQFIKSHGGFVRAESEPGCGLTMVLSLPASGDIGAIMQCN
jgi:two-component system nitrogen regulation sensor histidine kinase GlnL